jgi:hypothetical protein
MTLRRTLDAIEKRVAELAGTRTRADVDAARESFAAMIRCAAGAAFGRFCDDLSCAFCHPLERLRAMTDEDLRAEWLALDRVEALILDGFGSFGSQQPRQQLQQVFGERGIDPPTPGVRRKERLAERGLANGKNS